MKKDRVARLLAGQALWLALAALPGGNGVANGLCFAVSLFFGVLVLAALYAEGRDERAEKRKLVAYQNRLMELAREGLEKRQQEKRP